MADKVMTPPFRLSFPKIWEPEAYRGKGDPKYSITMLFDKGEDISVLKDAVKRVAEAKWKSKANGKNHPFKDGDKRDYEGYQNMIEVKATRKADFGAPVVVDRNLQEILDQKEIYPGCWCRAQVIPFAYEGSEDGVAFGLVAVQKLEDGDPMGGGESKESTINAFDDGSLAKSKPSKGGLDDTFD
jgi:hypothetical protein